MFIFELDCGYVDYVDWVINVLMFFFCIVMIYILKWKEECFFLDLMEYCVLGYDVFMKDWDLYLSMVFFDVCVKIYFEFRMVDVVFFCCYFSMFSFLEGYRL